MRRWLGRGGFARSWPGGAFDERSAWIFCPTLARHSQLMTALALSFHSNLTWYRTARQTVSFQIHLFPHAILTNFLESSQKGLPTHCRTRTLHDTGQLIRRDCFRIHLFPRAIVTNFLDRFQKMLHASGLTRRRGASEQTCTNNNNNTSMETMSQGGVSGTGRTLRTMFAKGSVI